uniref:Uncharacterized protein n=1 Tax=Myxococcus xanthus TaxID=34 RepID=O68872_MYXXA|nr:unknown [Myxococcus xanthus]
MGKTSRDGSCHGTPAPGRPFPPPCLLSERTPPGARPPPTETASYPPPQAVPGPCAPRAPPRSPPPRRRHRGSRHRSFRPTCARRSGRRCPAPSRHARRNPAGPSRRCGPPRKSTPTRCCTPCPAPPRCRARPSAPAPSAGRTCPTAGPSSCASGCCPTGRCGSAPGPTPHGAEPSPPSQSPSPAPASSGGRRRTHPRPARASAAGATAPACLPPPRCCGRPGTGCARTAPPSTSASHPPPPRSPGTPPRASGSPAAAPAPPSPACRPPPPGTTPAPRNAALPALPCISPSRQRATWLHLLAQPQDGQATFKGHGLRARVRTGRRRHLHRLGRVLFLHQLGRDGAEHPPLHDQVPRALTRTRVEGVLSPRRGDAGLPVLRAEDGVGRDSTRARVDVFNAVPVAQPSSHDTAGSPINLTARRTQRGTGALGDADDPQLALRRRLALSQHHVPVPEARNLRTAELLAPVRLQHQAPLVLLEGQLVLREELPHLGPDFFQGPLVDGLAIRDEQVTEGASLPGRAAHLEAHQRHHREPLRAHRPLRE